MQKIIWIGPAYFARSLPDCGFEDICVLPAPAGNVFGYADLVDLAGFEPDLVVVADNGGAPFLLGMEDFPCLAIFYSVNSHLRAWHGLYAQGFDAAIVSQASHVDRFVGPFLEAEHVWFMPPFAADPEVCDLPERQWDCLYLPGQTDAAFAGALARQIPGMETRQGDAAALSLRARIVVRQVEGRPGLDFGMFQAMASGACVVAPRVGHGMEKLFVDGEHLVGYAPNDAGDAAFRVNYLLEHPELVEHIGRAGRDAIDAAHLASHRAWEFTDHLFNLASCDVEALIGQRVENAAAIRAHCLTVPYLLCARQGGARAAVYEAAAKGKLTGKLSGSSDAAPAGRPDPRIFGAE